MVESSTYESVINWLERAQVLRVTAEASDDVDQADMAYDGYTEAVEELRSILTGKVVTMDELIEFALDYQEYVDQGVGHSFLVGLAEFEYNREHKVL